MKEANTSGRFADTNYEYFWGCELNPSKPAVTWSFEEEEGDTDFLDHTLFLKHAVLGAKAVAGERNLVQVETKNFDGDSLTQPLFSLTLGQNDCCFLDVSFGHRIPVTFRLVSGTGPVHISAQQLTEFPTANADDSQDDLYLKEVNTEDEEEDSPLKQAKKRKAGAQKNAKSKKGKLDASLEEEDEDESMDEDDDDELDEDEEDVDEDEDEDEEEDEESPPKKGNKGKVKKEQKGKAAANGAKAKRAGKAAANGKAAAKKGKKAKA